MTDEKNRTEYVVLALDRETETFTVRECVVAANDTAAIRAIEPEPGTYVAIPKRSFRERIVTASTVTQTRVN